MHIERCELDREQKKKWNETRSLMVWTCPGFRHIFYKMLTNNDGGYDAVITKSVPVAATDAKNILINPEKFFQYELRERVFITAHEIMHNVYGDVELLKRCRDSGEVPLSNGKKLKFVNKTMQIAMDLRINRLLKESKIGRMPEDAQYDEKWKATDTVYDIYAGIYEEQGGDGGDEGGEGGYEGDVLEPGVSTGDDPNNHQRNDQQWRVVMKTAQTLEDMRSKGDMPGALKRMFADILEPKVPWQDHIKTLILRRTGAGTYNWRKPDRRFIVRDLYMPGRSGFGAGWIAVWGDTSGSIGPDPLNRFLAELGGILEAVNPQRLTVYWCDARIEHEDEIEEPGDLEHIKFRGVGGGGGTSMMPVLKRIAQETDRPELFIGFTDGYVDFPRVEPIYPVIWANITPGHKYPFGEVVDVEV